MTSSIFDDRTVRGPWAPSTQARRRPRRLARCHWARPRGSRRAPAARSTGRPNDLKPFRVSDFKNTGGHPTCRTAPDGDDVGEGIENQIWQLLAQEPERPLTSPDDRVAAPAAGRCPRVVDLVFDPGITDLAEEVPGTARRPATTPGTSPPGQGLDHGAVRAADLLRAQRIRTPVVTEPGGERESRRSRCLPIPATNFWSMSAS